MDLKNPAVTTEIKNNEAIFLVEQLWWNIVTHPHLWQNKIILEFDLIQICNPPTSKRYIICHSSFSRPSPIHPSLGLKYHVMEL
jgi:hypothetical protein